MAIVSAKDRHARAGAILQGVRADFNAKRGQRETLTAQLEAMDRAGAEAVVAQREVELAALADEPAVAMDVESAAQELAAASRDLDEAKEALHKREGALSKVGGAAVRERVERHREALAADRVRERELEVDAESWKLLHETLREVEDEESAHLGRALEGPVTARFVELTAGRYSGLRLDASLRTEAVDVPMTAPGGVDVLEALSAGTRDQLATLIRLTIADQLRSFIVLDDHLVHTDSSRLAWFRELLLKTAVNTQVVVFTCRPDDYLAKDELPSGASMRDLAGGTIRAIDMAQVVKRWGGAPVIRSALGSEGQSPDGELQT